MTIPTPEDVERARAAVALSCLRWLECTGPADPMPLRRDPRAIRALLGDEPSTIDPKDLERPHPLWDAWLDA